MKNQSNIKNTSQRKKFLAVNYLGDYSKTIGSISLKVGGIRTELEIPLPTENVSAESMLPLFQELTNFLVEMSVKSAEKEGRTISCQKGCGACCSQLVPIKELEIGHLKRIVDDMPDLQKAIIHEKFNQATQQLAEANLLEKLRRPQNLNNDQRTQLALDYFKLNIPCPFLENQSCSIHPHRPMVCREYLVTSPVKHCSTPKKGKIIGVKIPRKVSFAVTRLTKQKKKSQKSSWFPLILIMESQQKSDNKQKLQSGGDWLKEILTKLS